MRASEPSASLPAKQPEKVTAKRTTNYANGVLRKIDITMTGRSALAASAA